MRSIAPTVAAACLVLAGATASHAQTHARIPAQSRTPQPPRSATALPSNSPPDPRLREVVYDPQAVISVPVRRGVVTHVLLDPGEALTEVGAGLGSDCSKPDASWCIAAQPGGRNLFVKPKSSAGAANNLAVVTDQRSYALRFVVLADTDPRPPVYRLAIHAPGPRPVATANPVNPGDLLAPGLFPMAPGLALPPQMPEPQVIAERLATAPVPTNTAYAIAEGPASADIVPTLVFDDGRFTYFRFPNNREVPAVFQVLGDGSETVVNARMEGDLLVVDRVARRLMLRAGQAVIGVWNEAFDLDGVPPTDGTTVAGVRRALKADDPATPTDAARRDRETTR